MNLIRFIYKELIGYKWVMDMRILLYNQDIVELKKMSLEVIEALENEKAMLDECCSFFKDKKKLNHVIYDIGIIDLSVGKENALFLVRHLRCLNSECMIILLGNSYTESEFAFEIKAAYFGLKEDCDINKTLKKVIAIYKKNNPWIYLYKNEKKQKIYLKDIVYVEVASKTLTIVCINQRYEVLRKENKNIIEFLCLHDFVKIHQSYYISFKNILAFKKGEVTLINGDSISVSLKYRKDFKERLEESIDTFR